jgi:hypothetical protein
MDKIADNLALVITLKLSVYPTVSRVTFRNSSSEKLSFALQLGTKLNEFCKDTL